MMGWDLFFYKETNQMDTKGQFPLYSHLRNELDTKPIEPLTRTQMIELGEKMKELDEQGCSLVYALIRYYQIYEDKQCAVDAPFNMKKVKNGYRFCTEELPVLLQHLIVCFVDLHLKAQKTSNQF